MISFPRLLKAAAGALLAAAAMAAAVSAEDISIDVSSAVESSGDWDQSFSYTTPVVSEKDGFDPNWMTADSDVIVEYSYQGKPPNGYPAELIWQTWRSGPLDPDPDVKKMWNRITPYEYDENRAKFSYADIKEAYGTENFSTVYAICVCDTGVKLTVTGITVTNCKNPNSPDEEPEQTEEITVPETESPEKTTSEITEKKSETTKAITEAETESETHETPAEKPEKKGVPAAVIIVIAIAVIAAAAIVLRASFGNKKDKYY